MPQLRRFNQHGMSQFKQFLEVLRADPKVPRPLELLADPTGTEVVTDSHLLEERTFDTRFEVAEFVDAILSAAGVKAAFTDTGLWAWLACYFFPTLYAPDAKGPGKPDYWIPEQSWKGYYRHRIAGPLGVYVAHRDHLADAAILLKTPASVHGEYSEQLASRQERVTSRAVVGVATTLYFNKASGTVKKGGQSRKKPGTLLRYLGFLDQLDLTYDLYSVTVDELLALLPPEFDRFKK
ncbi:MAG: hypothetical protein KF754_00465 [Planctomycetes bacterium]|nr:hypothetical protein [Planctomycetota bacterium]